MTFWEKLGLVLLILGLCAIVVGDYPYRFSESFIWLVCCLGGSLFVTGGRL